MTVNYGCVSRYTLPMRAVFPWSGVAEFSVGIINEIHEVVQATVVVERMLGPFAGVK